MIFLVCHILVDLPVYLTKKNNQDAQANGFIATLKDNRETKLGILQAAYGDYSFSFILFVLVKSYSQA